VQVHGLLEPLVNIDLSPEVNIMVKICHGEEERQELISVRQTVKQFKLYLQVYNILFLSPKDALFILYAALQHCLKYWASR
jgi:hypothetical protein